MDDVEVRYAKRGDVHIGYQVSGDGPIDLLALNSGCNVWIDPDGEVHWRRFDERLASFCRLIRFDPSGVGYSDPPPDGSMPTIELWMQDALTVLDAVGSKVTSLFAVGNGGHIAVMLSATHPERLSAQILMHCTARLARDADYRIGVPRELLDSFMAAVTDPNFDGEPIDDLGLSAPTLASDRSSERGGSGRESEPRVLPTRAQWICSRSAATRALLALIAVPTLVLHRVANPLLRIAHSRYLADHIDGATLVELPGKDHLPHVGDTEAVLGEIEEFLTGSRTARIVDRVLATILFTDIVASTERVAKSGDRSWRELLDNHDRMASREVRRFGGEQIKSTGDGILATFSGPAQAIRCGLALRDDARELGVEVRVGVHTGEVERRDGDIAGIGVHISSRVQGCAAPGEVWVSRTVTELVAGSGISFSDEGEHALKGVPGSWQLFSVAHDPETGRTEP